MAVLGSVDADFTVLMHLSFSLVLLAWKPSVSD